MKKKKRESKIIIHLSNRWLYFFITLGILAIVSVGVYAAQQASSGGGTHDYAEVGIPICSNGEILKWVELPQWMGGSSWECADDATGSSLWSVSGSNVYRSSGNVGIGTSNPLSKLSIGSEGSSYTTLYVTGVQQAISAFSTSYNSIGVGGYTKGGKGVYGYTEDGEGVYGRSDSGIGVRGRGTTYDFYASGPGTNYGSSSSIRWKENIIEISDALEKVMNLKGVYFDWDKEHGGQHDMGFIAEEVGEYVPEIVSYEKDGIYATGVDYGALTPMLVEAIKEQQKEIESLKSEIEKLKK